MYSNNFPHSVKPEFRYRVHGSSTLVRILSHMRPVDTPIPAPTSLSAPPAPYCCL